jgi:hypothetical protein
MKSHGRTGHKTVKVLLGQEIDIDVKLAPLIRQVWDAGLMTCQCCQEYRPGEACIDFPGTEDVCEFLHVAQKPYKVEPEMWDEGDEGEDAEQSIVVRLLVFFPTEDIRSLVKAFKRYNAESGRRG